MKTQTQATQDRAIRMPETTFKTGLSRASLYRLSKAKKFPQMIKLSARASGFLESEVNTWLESKKGDRNG